MLCDDLEGWAGGRLTRETHVCLQLVHIFVHPFLHLRGKSRPGSFVLPLRFGKEPDFVPDGQFVVTSDFHALASLRMSVPVGIPTTIYMIQDKYYDSIKNRKSFE